jgi:CheY-like chemotaxis protein
VVLDCGTGAHNLGQALLTSRTGLLRGHLLLTHMHWDHIQGLPFFGPLLVPGNEWDIYGPGTAGQSLRESLQGQMQYPYFPITLQQVSATIRYHDLAEGVFQLGSLRVTPRYLNHPSLTLGYRLDAGGVTVVYATDHEPHSRHPVPAETPAGPSSPGRCLHLEDAEHIKFLADADLVIHDAQYTGAEYPTKLGWGHSPVEYVVDVALAARVRRLALFHHDPSRTDEALDQLVEVCRQRVAACKGTLDVFAAAEGQLIELLEPHGTTPSRVGSAQSTPVTAAASDTAQARTVLIVDGEPDLLHLVATALEPEGYRLLSARDGPTALRIARVERPALILLDWKGSGRDGLEVCRALRAEADPFFRDVPVVLLTTRTTPEDLAAAFAAGASDYLTKPIKPSYVRSRVSGWLLRTPPHPLSKP